MKTVVGPFRSVSLIVLTQPCRPEARVLRCKIRPQRVTTEDQFARRAARWRTPAVPSTRSAPRCFGAAWGYKFDRAKLERNLAALQGAGVDYVRVLGSVGGPGWEDRETDPRWTDYDAVIAGLTDLALRPIRPPRAVDAVRRQPSHTARTVARGACRSIREARPGPRAQDFRVRDCQRSAIQRISGLGRTR